MVGVTLYFETKPAKEGKVLCDTSQVVVICKYAREILGKAFVLQGGYIKSDTLCLRKEDNGEFRIEYSIDFDIVQLAATNQDNITCQVQFPIICDTIDAHFNAQELKSFTGANYVQIQK